MSLAPVEPSAVILQSPMAKTALLVLIVFLLNLPFGFWRAGTRKLSLPWFVAVHAPVPLVVGLRLATGVGWQLTSFVSLVAAFFAGQLVGGRLRAARDARARAAAGGDG